jgi:hypothetical protein
MATLDASKSGRLDMINESSHANARDSTTADSTTVNPSSGTFSNAIRYSKAAGRKGNNYNIARHFYYFDTSGITGDVSGASVNILGALNETAYVILVPSTAFGGDGSADIVAADFNNITFDGSYSAVFTGWDDGANNSLVLKPTAANFIRDNDYFICAVIEAVYDYADNDPGSATENRNGINYGTAAYLDYTEASSGYANDVMGVATGNIGEVLGVATANIEKVIGV